MSINRASFQDIIERIHTIPTLPEIVTSVCRLVNDPSSHAKQIHDLVLKDQAMAAKMLRMVNSVYYSLPEPVHDLEQAVTILGFKTIRSLALSISVINMFQEKTAAFSMKAFWTHSAVSACLCRLICSHAAIEDVELGFVIGLIKDIGKVVLVENAPDETRSIIAVAREYNLPFYKAAREVIDTDDAEIGAWLIKHWQLEDRIVNCIRNQYDPDSSTEPKLVAMCQFSEYICGLKKIRVSGNYDTPNVDQSAWQHLGLDKNALMKVLSLVNDEVESARQLLTMSA
jgi:HD-like signal output (HDOD) protein